MNDELKAGCYLCMVEDGAFALLDKHRRPQDGDMVALVAGADRIIKKYNGQTSIIGIIRPLLPYPSPGRGATQKRIEKSAELLPQMPDK